MTRRFNDEEVALILREATLDEGRPASERERHALAPGDGLSLVELKEIAAEAGIDPTAVEQAALTLTARPRQSPFRVFLGTDSRVRVRTAFETSLDDRILGEALQEIGSFVTLQGVSNSLPSGVEWTAKDEWGSRTVSISATSDGSSLEVRGDFDNAARGAAGGAAVAAGVGLVGTVAAVAAAGPVAWVLAPVVAVGSVGITRLIAGRHVRKEGERLRQLANRLRALIVERTGSTDTHNH
jgi:hypothetical protein